TYGFLPSSLVSFVCWLFMTLTGLLILEVTLWMEEGAHVISMTKRFLGRVGEVCCGGAFVFLYYCLLVSYYAGGAPLLGKGLVALGIAAPPSIEHLLFGLLFSGIVFAGARAVDRLNQVLVLGMLISYVLLVLVGSQGIQEALLSFRQWKGVYFVAPTLFGAYGFHNIIPSMTNYLNRNVAHLRLAILGGTTITFIVYGLWQGVVLGSVDRDALVVAREQGVSVVSALETVTNGTWLPMLGSFFALFALVTSLLGVSFSMVDFLGDGLSIKNRHGKARALLCVLVFVPPLILSLLNPGIFVGAMGAAGGFGEAFLNGLVPISMVWIGRYRMGLQTQVGIPGGRALLILLALITTAVIAIETWSVL
ncbi:MAG: hypothetical protein KDK78_08175, partial [Chlamydiia bacterium]|nr:hypothetical protein [Chlamydiia bacterium]